MVRQILLISVLMQELISPKNFLTAGIRGTMIKSTRYEKLRQNVQQVNEVNSNGN